MLKNVKELERYIAQGFVLNKQGQWRPMDEVIAEEIEFLRHLENGEILESGHWVKLDEVITGETAAPILDDSAPEQPDETAGQYETPEIVPAETEETIDEDAEETVNIDKETIVSSPVIEEPETENRETVAVQSGFMDTVALEKAARPSDMPVETTDSAPEQMQRAEDEDSETKRYELETLQLETAQTRVIDKESIDASLQDAAYTDDELLSTDEFESVISEMAQEDFNSIDEEVVAVDINSTGAPEATEDDQKPFAAESSPPSLPEESPVPTRSLSSEPIVPFNTESQDEWDRARTRNLKVLIGSVAGAIILITALLLKLIL